MQRWKSVRMDERQRVALPVEALAAMGWGWDEELELSVSPTGNALLLRAQASVPPRCCACQSGGPLLPVGGGKWLCAHCFEIASLANAR